MQIVTDQGMDLSPEQSAGLEYPICAFTNNVGWENFHRRRGY